MHPTLATFATSYRHRFTDLTITTNAGGEDLLLEWQESPTSPCYKIEVYVNGEGVAVFDYTGGFIDADLTDLYDVAVAVVNRERGDAPILAAPGTFGAIVLERHLLRLSARPHSPDRLTR